MNDTNIYLHQLPPLTSKSTPVPNSLSQPIIIRLTLTNALQRALTNETSQWLIHCTTIYKYLPPITTNTLQRALMYLCSDVPLLIYFRKPFKICGIIILSSAASPLPPRVID